MRWFHGWAVVAMASACTSEPPREPTLVTVHLTSQPANGVVAFQDGDGPWQQAPASDVPLTYQFTITAARYGVGWACIEPDRYSGDVYRTGTLHYQRTDEEPEVHDSVACRYAEQPGTTPVSTTCVDGLAHSTWAADPFAVRYVWMLTYRPHHHCGSTHTDCVYQWRTSIAASVAGDRPAFDQPGVTGLVGWPTQFRPACYDDGAHDVTVRAE